DLDHQLRRLRPHVRRPGRGRRRDDVDLERRPPEGRVLDVPARDQGLLRQRRPADLRAPGDRAQRQAGGGDARQGRDRDGRSRRRGQRGQAVEPDRISVGSALTAVVQGNTTAITVKSYDNGTGAITIEAESKGAWGDDISVRAFPQAAGSFALLADPTIPDNDAMTASITADVSPASQSFTITAGMGAKLKAGDHITVAGKPFTLAGAPAGDTVTVAEPAQVWKAGWS